MEIGRQLKKILASLALTFGLTMLLLTVHYGNLEALGGLLKFYYAGLP